ncbi:MAG: chitobiase/beta-hexosaminidase C-terminal domain-containing protein, partial [Verrucomicrobia bacterium]|nr:chitobiase/beta-hexosaminidase C-terminal domain-containing protein [Verrucomicrobiota bacterium]
MNNQQGRLPEAASRAARPPPARSIRRVLPLLLGAGLSAACVQANAAAAALPALLINELQPSNGETLRDEDGDSPDWFELWNPGSAPVDLAGWAVSDDPDRPRRWVFPSEQIPPQSFLVVYASGKDRRPEPAIPVNPANLAGLRLWLSAEAMDPEAVAQVRAVGETRFVRSWISRAGEPAAAVQNNPSAQPRWLSDGGEGFPVLRFDGRDDQLNLPHPPATNSFCLFLVCRPRLPHQIDDQASSGVGGVSGQRYVLGAQHGGEFGAGVGLSAGTNGISVYEHGAGYMPAVLVSHQTSPFGWFLVAVNYRNGAPTLDVNGLTVAHGARSPRDPVTAPVEIGRGAYGAFNGDVAELLVFDRPLSAEERRGLAAHFALRYGWKLPRPLHTNFQLNAGGETLLLLRPDGSVADQATFGATPRDVSLGRRADGAPGWFYFAEPTPGRANTTPAAEAWLEPPSFSHPGGFYTAPFDLVLASADPDATIRYTLDGSEPGPDSSVYTGPLHLDDRSGTPNGISQIPTVPGGLPPAGEVYKGWVVRARAFRAGALASSTVTRTFWVHPRGAGRYSVPVVSLAVEPADFFDPDRGIYVPGHAPNGNYSQRGPDWERPVHVEVYENDGTLLLAQEGDVKIHGNTSQGFPIKGLDLDGTGGRGRRPFVARLFPDRPRDTFEHFLLRPTGHDQQRAFMRDELIQSLAAGAVQIQPLDGKPLG